ncbi:MAG: hypothetical protein WB812_12055 [Woeseiaceae bacterium]
MPPSAIAVVYASLGEADPAIEWLNRGVAQNNLFCKDLEDDEDFDSLKSDPRFQSLVERCWSSLKAAGNP